MQYIGLHTQQVRNNIRSAMLLCLFPCLVVGLLFAFCLLFAHLLYRYNDDISLTEIAMAMFISIVPYVLGGILLWFLISYFAHTSIIRHATGARPLTRKENKRVYNLVENLCISKGMSIPQINIIDDDSLNAYASGIDQRSYTVTLSQGIIDKLNDEELEGVIAHELTHIRNHDVRLLIISIVFVGLFSMLAETAMRSLYYAPRSRNKEKNDNTALILLLVALLSAIGYFFASLMRFAISRKREYMADAGSAEMTKNPLALASALRKISHDPQIEAVTRNDIAQLFIEHPSGKGMGLNGFIGLFSTHPPIAKRIEILEQF